MLLALLAAALFLGTGGHGNKKVAGLNNKQWNWVNAIAWAVVKIAWVTRCAGADWGYTVAAYTLGVYAWGTLFAFVISPKLYKALGAPLFVMCYSPVLMVNMYFLIYTDLGLALSAIPWWELLLFSSYRIPMEVPWEISIENGTLPGIMGSPFHACKPFQGPFKSTFKCGLIVDGICSWFGLPLALWAYLGSAPIEVVMAYEALGVATLMGATVVILSNLPAPNPMAMWNCKPTTASFLDHPAPVQGFYGSQLGYIIAAIAVRKYLGA